MFDGETMFSNKQDVTGTVVSDNILHVQRDIGGGTPLYLEVDCPPVAGATLTVNIQHGDLEDMSDAATCDTHVVDPDALTRGGCVLCAPLTAWNRKYLRLSYTATGNLSITAGITTSRQTADPQGRKEEFA